MKIFVGDSMKPQFHNLVISGILTYLLNLSDAAGSSAPESRSQHSPKPGCHYTQISNIIIQDLLEGGQAFY
jgi:hypothetical protein